MGLLSTCGLRFVQDGMWWIAKFFVALWDVLGCRPGFFGFNSPFTGKFVFALSLQLDLERPGLGMGASPRVLPQHGLYCCPVCPLVPSLGEP